MAKWTVRLIYKDIIEVEVEADDKEAAIAAAVERQEEDGGQTDYFLDDAEVRAKK